MKCEKCGKNEATMYYKETVNGVTRELHLCPECAQKENLGGAFAQLLIMLLGAVEEYLQGADVERVECVNLCSAE